MIRRGVMSVWKVILLAIGSLVGVAGVTTLGVYISGGLKEKFVEPQDIYFSQVVESPDKNADTLAYYVDNASYSAEYKTSGDFMMTVSSNTEDVTEKELQLSFEGTSITSGDYIEDGIIKVPKAAEIGKPFKVELVKAYNSTTHFDTVVGGNSILTIKSSNLLLDPISTNICVDVPVSDFYILPTGETKNSQNAYTVYSDTEFTVDEIFKPTNSKFLFSDTSASKLVFFDIQGENITYSYQTKKFHAGQNGTVLITAYTFSNSFYQRERLAQYGYTYEEMTPAIMENIKTTILADARLAANTKKYKSASVTLQISSATIDSISFAPAGNKYDQVNERFEAYANKYLRLTTNSTTVGDATFGVSVTATAGEANTGALLSNMGIKITGDSNLSILGGRVAKVTATSVEFEDYSKTKDYAPTSEVVYYLLPNTAPQDYNNYFWQISSTAADSTPSALEINFFTKDENGVFVNFFEIEGFKDGLSEEVEKTFNVLFKERKEEVPPAWADQDTISMLINYKQDGSIEPSSKDLTKDIQKTDKWNENVYQEIRYFVFIDDKDAASILPASTDLEDYFVCTLSGSYMQNYIGKPLVVDGTAARGEGNAYKLYEIADGMLIAKESFTGEVKVFVATIQTKADGAPIMDGAKYKLVNTSYVRTVKVESTLSIRNIVSENTGVYLEGTKGEDFIEIETEYYIPATNEGIINLKIYLKGVEDADKLIRAVNIGNAEGGVYFTCVDGYGDETANYLTLKNFAQKTTGEPEGFAVFEGTFAINQQFFEPNLDILSLGKEIFMQLSYNNGKEIQSEILPLFVDGAKVSTEGGDVCHFNVYYPQPVEINWTSENATDLYEGGVVDNGLATINVDIKAAGQTIVWGSRELPAPGAVGSAVDQLNALLEFTLKDQFGREIDQSSGEYQMKFVETAQTVQEKIINLSAEGNKIASFSSANNKPTMLEAYVYKDRKDKIYTYDESGNKTGVELKYGKQFNFKVKSEGVSFVGYDSSTLVREPSLEDYREADSMGAVTISKYIEFNTSETNMISLEKLIKVYVGDLTYTGNPRWPTQTPVQNLHFYFDNTYISSLSSITTAAGDSAKESLLKMIEITGPDGVSKTSGLDTIDAWIGKRVTSLKFVCSFDQTTTIRFVAKDENESLFNITVDLVCMQDVYESNMIASKNEELGYSDYLIEKDNAISIFADKKYDLNEILPLYTANYPAGTNYKKAWLNMWGDLSVGQLYQTDKEDIVKITHEEGSVYYYLKIEPCTTFTTAELTIYIRKTYYSFKISLKLYINPNIIAVATEDTERQELDAKSVFGKNLSDYYNFYRATDYIDYYITHKSGAAEPEALGTTSWTATNTCDSKYLALDLYKSEKQFMVGADKTLTLALGEKVNQDFAISKGETSGVYGIRKYGSTIVKSDTNQLSLKFNLKYGGTDSIFDETVEKVQKVQYKGNTYLVLVSEKEYEFNDGLTLYNNQTYGVVNKQNTTGSIYVALNNSLISLDNNGFDMQETATDGTNTLTIVSHINVIATATGDKFVYYNNGALPDNAGEMKFNYYNDYTDFETLVTNYYKENDSHTRLGENGYALLEETYFYQVGQQQASYNICQELYAGQTYKIIHYSNNLDDDFAAGQVFGFYYDSSEIDDMYNIEVSIVEGADGYIPGIVSYNSTTNEISIIHTESQIETYIVLRLSISKKNSTAAPVVWFYRIKVVPSFTLGNTNYPYAQDAEYLDKYSREYYISSYVAPENTDYYSDTNLSNKVGELSKSELVLKVEGKQYYTFDSGTTYYVKAADVKVYDYKIDFSKPLTATNSKHNSEELRIENVSLGFTYYVKPEDITFVAQSGEKYYTNTECTADEEELLEDKVLTFEDGHYSFEDSSIYYVKPERVKFFANTAAYYFDDECIRQAGKTSAEKEVQKNGDEKYYFTISFDATKTFSVKTAYVDSEEISPENYSNYFEYNFVGEVLNITPVDDTTKLTIVVARTLSLDEKDLIGGENTYTLRFNQSKDYVANLITTDNKFYIKEEDVDYYVDDDTAYFSTSDCDGTPVDTLNTNTTVTKVLGGDNYQFKITYYVKSSDVSSGSAASGKKFYLEPECENEIGELEGNQVVQPVSGGTNYYFEKTFYVLASSVKYSVASGKDYYLDKSFANKAGTTTENKQLLKDAGNNYYFLENCSTNPTIIQKEKSFETTLKADGKTTTFTIDLKEQAGAIQSDISDFKAYVKEDYADYFTFTFNSNNKTISIQTADSISQDKTFTIVVYTDTQIAFYIDLTIVGNYTITQNITQLDAESAYRTTLPFGQLFTIKNASNEDVTGYSIAAEENAPCTISGTDITFSHLTEDRLINFTLTISGYNYHFTILVKANFEEKARSYNNTTLQYGQKSFDITLAELAGAFTEIDATNFKFIKQNGETITSITITPPNVSTSQVYYEYLTLGYYFNGKKVFEVPITYSYTVYKNVNVVAHYPSPAGTELSVEYISAEPSHGSGGTHSADLNDFFNSMANFAEKNRIVVEDVAYAKTGTLFYTNLACNEGETALSEQVVVKKVNENAYKFEKENITYYVKAAHVETGFTRTWRLAITSIENLTIRINDTNYNSAATGISANGENKYNIRFTLSGSFAQGSATFLVCVNEVEVEYSVIFVDGNNFTIETNAPNYASVTDKSATPVTANAETIYAEDLANQEQNLFAENRILKYAFKSGVVNGTTYYIKLENDVTHTVAMAKIVSDGTTNTKNIDLGRSYKGYAYKGSYSNYSENMFVGNALDDDQIYAAAPTLTKRVVAKYKNGDEIKTGIVLKAKATEDSVASTDLNTFSLGVSDFRTIKTGIITATISGTNKETGINYNIYLDSYYSISGVVESANSYTTITLNADYDSTHSATTLLTNTSLGISLTVEQMKQYGGNFTLLTYGFNDCPINYVNVGTPYYDKAGCTGDPAGEVDKRVNVRKQGVNYVDIDDHYFKAKDVASTTAAALHNYLKTVPDGDITYYTGLTPRAGAQIDPTTGSCGERNGDITKNYITISGLQYNGKNYDYNISPQGANNDGNYVMMKLVYTITISAGQSIDIENDILFKVLPSSTVTFKSGYGASSYYSASTIIEDGKTITTNRTTPYTIHSDGNQQTFYFAEETEQSNDEVIKALMYKNNSNSSGAFTYEFNGNSENWPFEGDPKYYVLEASVSGGKASAGTSYYSTPECSGTAIGTTTAEQKVVSVTGSENYQLLNGVVLGDKTVTVQNLVLGEKNFYIDATNDFDYKLRFYFKVVAETNPVVAEMSSQTLTEGQDLVVGAKYQTITPTMIMVGTKQYTVFEQTNYKAKTSPEPGYENTINITGSSLSNVIIQATVNGTTAYKKYSTVPKLSAETEVTQISGGTNYQFISGADTYYVKASAVECKAPAGTTYYSDQGCTTMVETLSEETTVTQISSGENYQFTSGTDTYYVLASAVKRKAPADTPYYTNQECTKTTITIEIFETNDDDALNTKWYESIECTGTKKQIQQNQITNFRLYVKASSALAGIAITYGENKISQQLTRDTTLTLPTFGSVVDNTQTITLTGLKANAISNSAGAISTDALNTYKSNVQDVKVKQIEFFYGEISIGSDAVSPYDYSSSKSLITSNGVCFYNDTGFTGGEQYSSGLEFTVPTINNGFLYGTGASISGVTMKITLTDGTNECVVSKENVTIQRKDATKLTFKNNAKVYDGSAPEVETTSGTVYNDTLEVELAPGASTTFVLTTKGAVGGTLSEETTVTQIANGENYQFISGADTYYVKASAVEGKAPADTSYYSDQECTILAGTLAEETTVTQILSGENYQFTSGADTYYVKASAVESKAPADTPYYLTPDCSDTFVSSEFMTLTNTESYTLTRYIGIHTNIAGLTENVMSFNLFVKESTGNVKFNYNGSTIDLDDDISITLDGESKDITGKLNNAIEQYSQSTGSTAGKPINLSALNLHIASVQELSASHKKNVRLFFLFTDKTTSPTTQYQQYQDFEVSPLYTSTNYDQSILIVDNYYKLSNGDDTFYVVPLSSWATTTLNGINTSAISGVDSYKLHFEINESLGGSAFIDENGTITTASNIDLHTEKIFVNVYMKVSGTDGKFEDENGILLATITLALDPSISWESATQTNAGVYKVGNEIVVIPTGYSAYKTSSLSAVSSISTTIDNPSHAFSIDHTLTKQDFENMFGKDDRVDDWINRNYHIVYTRLKDKIYTTKENAKYHAYNDFSDEGQELTEQKNVQFVSPGVYTFEESGIAYYVKAKDVNESNYQYTNNLNEWTFPSTGTWLVNVVVTGRDDQIILNKTVYIYDANSSASEETKTAQILTLSSEMSVTKVEGGENYQFTSGADTYYVKGSAVAAGKAPAGTPYYTNKDCTISSANLPLTGFKEISSIDNSLVENPTVNSAGIYTKQ